ncbi:MAG TPA: gliding motility-associated C-terminal domain-containing protein, partial [Chryseolinea sp.]
EIRDQMCKKLTGNESNLIGYWTFDELSGNTLKDISPNHFDGILNGNPARVFSGAPIGDISTNLYSNSWLGKTLKLDNIEVANVVNNPGGVHIYKVNSVPSQTGGLTDLTVANPYYGVFLASLDRDDYFDVSNVCNFFVRSDNSASQWVETQTLKSVNERQEIVALEGEEIIFDLGVYRVLCDQSSYTLESGITELSGKSFKWNTGDTTPDISITKSGLYWVEISNGCGIFSDTVNVLFEKKPSFSLGPDETLCLTQPKLLDPYDEAAGLHFKWQDGSTAQSFEVHEPGTYWVTIENICGASTDSIRIEKRVVEAVDIGLDKIICDQSSQSLESGIQDLREKSFLWSTGQSTSSIEVNKSGIYHLSVTTVCGIDRDTVNILFLKKPTPFDLGQDEELCVLPSKILKPYDAKGEFEYKWQDGSTLESMTIKDFGVYWLTVNNACGIASDTVTFSRRPPDNQEIPNIITPNGDLFNQNFVIEKEIRATNQLKLYNRWGEEVYSSDDYRNDWDGDGVPSGVYFYHAVGDCIGERRGALTISR